jgi:hypothetical protein
MGSAEIFEDFLQTAREHETGLTFFQDHYNVTVLSSDYATRLRQAVPALKGAQLFEEVKQVSFFAELEKRFQEGNDFSTYAFVVHKLFPHHDYQHKIKNIVSKVRYQKPDIENDSFILNLGQLKLAAASDTELKHLVASLDKSADKQVTANSIELLYSRTLQKALLRLGHRRTACVLRVMGDAHQAVDMPGLSMPERNARLQRAKTFYATVLGPNRFYSVQGEKRRRYFSPNNTDDYLTKIGALK